MLLNLQQVTAEEIARELHKIAKSYRSEATGSVGSYIGLNLSVRSEYHYTGVFERNIFLVEGKRDLKYKCGLSGALPLGFVDSAAYPQASLDKFPQLIGRQQEKIGQLVNEIQTLQQKIDDFLKELEQQPTVTAIVV